MFLAKSDGKTTVPRHTIDVGKGEFQILKLYGHKFSNTEKELIYSSGAYHDLGKQNYNFNKTMHTLSNLPFKADKKLDNFYKSIYSKKLYPHGYLSPAFIDENWLEEHFDEEDISVLINAIVYHHAKSEKPDSDKIEQILDTDPYLKNGTNREYLMYIYNEYTDISDEEWLKYCKVKGVLNKADYWASAMEKAEGEVPPPEIPADLHDSTIESKVEDRFKEKGFEFRAVQKYMQGNKDKNLVVIASTGIGKTEAALLWLGNEKGFYTLPLKVSINAIYERIKSEYGYETDKLMLMHSDAFGKLIETEEDDAETKFKNRQYFPFPLTVCTVDQLFTFVYRYFGCEILVAVLSYSKLIIDEIQAYSPDIIGKLIYGLKLLTAAGGKFAIITATMPPVFEYFMEKENIDFRKNEKPFLSPIEKRHFIKYNNCDFDTDFILEEGKSKKVLVLCNTVGKAQEIYKKLFNACGSTEYVKLLHSAFLGKDRAMLEKEIIEFSDDREKTGIWVSTQIVEASLDIDFDVLFTQMCTSDSLLQRMGRCYRKRTYDKDVPNVYVYDETGIDESKTAEDRKVNGIYDRLIYNRSVKYLLEYDGKIFFENEKIDYINKVYAVDEEMKSSSYFKGIQKEINSCKKIKMGIFNRSEAVGKFRDIMSTRIIPREVYDRENEHRKIDEIIERRNNGNIKIKAEAEKELRDYTISLSWYIKDKLQHIPNADDIFIMDRKYEFDEENGFTGLLKKENEKSDEGEFL